MTLQDDRLRPGFQQRQYSLAMQLLNSDSQHGVNYQSRRAFDILCALAEGGHADAMYSLGVCYADGHGAKQDKKKSLEFYRRAAECGSVDAQYLLGRRFEYGHGELLQEDVAQAVKWFRKVAEQGYAVAQFRLAECLMKLKDAGGDCKKEAVEWYRKAAEQSNANAMAALARCYARGEGIEKNEALAQEWREKAKVAGLGDADSDKGDEKEDSGPDADSDEQRRKAVAEDSDVGAKQLAAQSRRQRATELLKEMKSADASAADAEQQLRARIVEATESKSPEQATSLNELASQLRAQVAELASIVADSAALNAEHERHAQRTVEVQDACKHELGQMEDILKLQEARIQTLAAQRTQSQQTAAASTTSSLPFWR